MGNSHHAAPGLDRESQAGCGTDCHRQDRPEPCRLLGGQDYRDGGKGPEEPDSYDRRHGTIKPAHGQLLCCGACPSPPGTGRRAGTAPYLDRAATFRVLPDYRPDGSIGESAASGGPAFHQQQHRKSPIPERHGLAPIRR